MSYTIPSPQPTITGLDALVTTIRDNHVPTLTDTSISFLTGNGQVAQLTPLNPLIDGTATFPVWGSCVPQDDPGVPGLQMFSLIIAGRNSAPWMKANGEPVATWFWHTVQDVDVATHTLAEIRKALLLFLLGEQATPPIITNSGDAFMDSLSIVTKANAALQQEVAVAPAL